MFLKTAWQLINLKSELSFGYSNVTENDYLNAWLAYFVGAVLLVLVWWRISRKWPHWLKYPSLLAVSVALLIPFNIEEGSLSMAPAWLVTFFEGVFLSEIGFVRVGPTLLTGTVIAALLYPLLLLTKRLLKPAKPSESNTPEASDSA